MQTYEWGFLVFVGKMHFDYADKCVKAGVINIEQ